MSALLPATEVSLGAERKEEGVELRICEFLKNPGLEHLREIFDREQAYPEYLVTYQPMKPEESADG